MSSSIEEIKSRLSIEEVVARYVPLKKAGRNLKGLCPFHNEKTPSFVVSPEKQLAYCFGCHRGGDIFKFTQEMEGVEFPEALKMLAERAGVKLDTQRMDPKVMEQRKTQKTGLYRMHQDANDFFQRNLWETPAGKPVLQYLEKRGIDEKLAKEFELGVSPDSFDQTYQFLLKKGFSRGEIVQGGLAKSKDVGSERIYDHFRGRLMFPIWDDQGRVVGFGGRALKAEVEPKYLNSPETPIYDKSKLLYNFNRAKREIRNKDQILVVEGYMDVIACHKIGSQNVVASSGTALTVPQLNLMKRFTKNVVFGFDQDTAGQDALNRAVELAQGMDFKIKVLILPEGKDPDEYINRHGENWIEQLEAARSYLDFYFEKYQQAVDTETEEGRRDFMENLMPVLRRITNRVEKDRQVQRAAIVLGVKAEHVYDELEKIKDRKVWTPEFSGEEESSGPVEDGMSYISEEVISDLGGENITLKSRNQYTLEEYIFGLVIQFPQYAELVLSKLEAHYFSGDLAAVYKLLKTAYNSRANSGKGKEQEDFSFEEHLVELESAVKERFQVVSLWVETQNECLAEAQIEKEVEQVLARLQVKYFDRQKRDLLLRMQKAKIKGKLKEAKELFKQYCQWVGR